ncbi:hypothetical protein D3C72_1168340 [compost metagenome]
MTGADHPRQPDAAPDIPGRQRATTEDNTRCEHRRRRTVRHDPEQVVIHLAHIAECHFEVGQPLDEAVMPAPGHGYQARALDDPVEQQVQDRHQRTERDVARRQLPRAIAQLPGGRLFRICGLQFVELPGRTHDDGPRWIRQQMRAVKKCPAATAGDAMRPRCACPRHVVRVMVRVAGYHQCEPVAQHALDLAQASKARRLGLNRRHGAPFPAAHALHLVDPARLGRAQYHAVAGLELRIQLLEVLALRPVDFGLQLQVQAPDPPAAGQLQGVVAGALACLPAAHGLATAEQAGEAAQAIVPVVIARRGDHPRRIRQLDRLVAVCGARGLDRRRERRAKRIDEAAPVAVMGRRRVHLVAAQQQHLGPRQRHALVAQRHRVADAQCHGVGRVPAVARVCHIVDPDTALFVSRYRQRRIRIQRAERGLHHALVRKGADSHRHGNAHGSERELQRAQPVHHGPLRVELHAPGRSGLRTLHRLPPETSTLA